MNRKYPLQIAISTLFIAITVSLVLVLSWLSYSKSSEIMLGSAQSLYQRIAEEVRLEFSASYGNIRGSLNQLSLSPITTAKTGKARMKQVDYLKAVLESQATVSKVGVGYADGTYLGMSRVPERVHQQLNIPASSRYIVFYINRNEADVAFVLNHQMVFILDRNLNLVKQQSTISSDFDVRERLWYQLAGDEVQSTVPYLFHQSQQVGITAMRKARFKDVVVFADITLDTLNKTINQYQLSASSEVVLFNDRGQVFAYKDQQKIVQVNDEEIQMVGLNQLGSDVLDYINTQLTQDQITQEQFDFEFKNQQWIGSKRLIARSGGVGMYALMLSPVDELLKSAAKDREELMLAGTLVLLVFIPLIWFTSRRIAKPLNTLAGEAHAISNFDFSETPPQRSFIKEVSELDSAMELMKSTINKFISLIDALAGEQNLDHLLKKITSETMQISQSRAALIYLFDENNEQYRPAYLCGENTSEHILKNLAALNKTELNGLLHTDHCQHDNYQSCILTLEKNSKSALTPLLDELDEVALKLMLLPLLNRNNETIGLLTLIYPATEVLSHSSNIAFVEALSGFSAVTLESRQLFKIQEALLHSFIRLIAGAIDSKSPYTGGHCQRVPEITLMLAKAACESKEEKFRDFNLDKDEWDELSIACWLHDCGKVTTPEYVVDKATKLETIYDRIHEIRTRFEVLKRDAEIQCWQRIAKGGDSKQLLAELEHKHQLIDNDFAFIADCNLGGEFMEEEKLARLQTIASKTWLRTLDDSLGLSWEELSRKRKSALELPVEEKLLQDKDEHLIARHDVDKMPLDNEWGFKVDTPEFKYNRGELYNLSVKRGTLNDEERYMINGHMIQTIMMLSKLPYPKKLKKVPLIAGSHHETMDGKGYPKKLVMSEQPLTARMMVIADIFEALTASDRPYKKAKSLSESLKILSFMRNDKHIDPDLFDLFLRSGVYLQYAEKFLLPEQIDDVNVEEYL